MLSELAGVEAWAFRVLEAPIDPLPADHAQAASIPDIGRRLFAARSRTIVRRILGARFGRNPTEVEWTRDPSGKPRIEGCEFSISHSGPWLVVVTGEFELGVDIETRVPTRDVTELARRFFSASDYAALMGASDLAVAFQTQWVAKEAALKVSGLGIAGGLARAECLFCDGRITGVNCGAERFEIRPFAVADGTRGAIAWRQGPQVDVRWREAAEIG